MIYVRRRCTCSKSLLSPLSYRIKEELGGSERCQEAVTIGWQRFKQLTGQFSSGHIDCSCYLSSFLNLFPNDPHRRHTEVKRPSAHFDDYTLCCICVTLFQAALRHASRACDYVSKQQRRSASSVRIYLSLHAAFCACCVCIGGYCAAENYFIMFCSYLHIVRSFGGGGDAAPAGLAIAGKTAAAIIKVTVVIAVFEKNSGLT